MLIELLKLASTHHLPLTLLYLIENRTFGTFNNALVHYGAFSIIRHTTDCTRLRRVAVSGHIRWLYNNLGTAIKTPPRQQPNTRAGNTEYQFLLLHTWLRHLPFAPNYRNTSVQERLLRKLLSVLTTASFRCQIVCRLIGSKWGYSNWELLRNITSSKALWQLRSRLQHYLLYYRFKFVVLSGATCLPLYLTIVPSAQVRTERHNP